jgi:Flp pilus assembly protein TadD
MHSLYRRGYSTVRLSTAAILLAAICAEGCATTNLSRTLSTGSRAAPSQKSSGFSAATAESLDPALGAALLQLLVDKSPMARVRVASRYYQLGIRDKAMDYYSEALTIDPKHAPALDGRARVWRDWGFIGQAMSDAHRATYFAPASAPAQNTLGIVLQALHQDESAARAFRKAADLDPKAAYALNNLCYLSFIRGRTEDAARDCSEALAREASFVPAQNNLGLAYAALGYPDVAFGYFRSSAGDAVARYNMGIVFLAERRYSAAAKEFQAAFTILPSFLAARRRAIQAANLARESSDVRH